MKKIDDSDIPHQDLSDARRISAKEVKEARRAITKQFGIKRFPGRPLKRSNEKYRTVNMRLHPKALHWAHTEAKRLGIGYQTFINQILLRHAA